MTKQAAVPAGAPVTTDLGVAEYLEAYPDFFERHPQLLQRIRLPDARGGGTTVSLVERQVDVLRERNRQLEKRLAEFIENARANDALAAKIHRLTTRLVHARGLDRGNRRDRGLAARGLRRAARGAAAVSRRCVPRRARVAIHAASPAASSRKLRSFETLFAAGKPRCGQVRDTQRDFLFGEDVGDDRLGGAGAARRQAAASACWPAARWTRTASTRR